MSKLFEEIIKLNKVFSTNDIAKKYLENTHKNFVIVADEQEHGRGQRGKDWESPLGGLWFSICYLVKDPVPTITLNILINNAVIDSISSLFSKSKLRLQPKWPNDIYLEGKKLSGILIEGIENEYYIIGVGINTNNTTVYENAISLQKVIGEPVNNDELLKSILHRFEYLTKSDHEKEFIRWKRNNLILKKKVKIKTGGKIYNAIVQDIDNTGSLILDNGMRIISGSIISFE